jgi:hypothetical protein
VSSYLLTYDAFQFNAYLETLVSSNTNTPTGATKQHQSPWMLTDAANLIFQSARRRCYTMSSIHNKKVVIDLADDDDAWDALDEAEGTISSSVVNKGKGKETDSRPKWLPDGVDPVLEELPKWHLLSEILLEAEGEIIRQENLRKPALPGMLLLLVLFFSSCSFLNASFSQRHLVEHYSCHDFVDTHLQYSDRISFDHGYGCFTWFSWATDDDEETTSLSLVERETEPEEARWDKHSLCDARHEER